MDIIAKQPSFKKDKSQSPNKVEEETACMLSLSLSLIIDMIIDMIIDEISQVVGAFVFLFRPIVASANS